MQGYGIVPGLNIQLELTVGNRTELYPSRIEEIADETIGVLVPMQRLKRRPLPGGSIVRVTFVHGERRRRFVSEVTGHSSDGMIDYLAMPADVEDNDRRGSYRLDTALAPESLFRLFVVEEDDDRDVSIKASVVNMSEGGLCFTTRADVRAGERLAIQLELPTSGTLNARLRVIDVEDPNRNRWSRRVHCKFTNLSHRERDLIARFLMKRQLELRRRGQL
ncbi:MAG: flagellar brake protein [Dehalococcoidia bacterium]|nr:flagellar brake protein [Dehalococcoidia bacterium]